LQYVAELVFAGEDKEYDLIINVPPGTTKSIAASVMYQPWTMLRMPRIRHICVSHTHDLVLDLSTKSRELIESEKFKYYFPEVADLREDQNTKGYWKNLHGGSRFSCTVGGKPPTGFHAHILSVDDPIDPEKSISEKFLNRANRYLNVTLPSRAINKRKAPTILIMQRLHQNDPTGNRMLNLKAGKVKLVCLPADDSWEILPRRLKKYYRRNKGLLDPVRLPRSVLREQKAKLGNYGYSGQYGQNPVPLKGGMFKVDKFVMIQPPRNSEFAEVIRYWDKAYTQDGGAYTAGVKIGRLRKEWLKKYDGIEFWILHVHRGQWASHKRERHIQRTADRDTDDVTIAIEQEGGAGKESAEGTVRGLAGYRVRTDIPKKDKTLRADPFSVQVNSGNVALARGEWNQDYVDELRFFPNSTYKDQTDASSGAFAMLTRKKKRAGAIGRRGRRVA